MSSPHNECGRSTSGGNAAPLAAGAVTEEGPTMRAVAMMSGGPSLIDGRGGFSFGKAPPLGLSRPPVGLKPLSKGPREGSFEVKKEWSGVSSSAIWNVKGETLEQIPLGFQLERTHREIIEDASVVASRITESLRSLSIEAKFDCEKAKVKCKTSDCVGFRIRLYAGGETGQPVVVEVQRRCGSASVFMHSCRAILNAAEGKAFPVKNASPLMSMPIGQMKCLQSIVHEESKNDNGSEGALDGVMVMLRSSRSDLNLLGLENLCCLTDPLRTAPTAALRISKCVTIGDVKYDIREEIRVLTERDVFASGFDQEQEGADRHVDQLRHLALKVFANSLSMCSKDGCLVAPVKEQKWFGDNLIPSLVDEVKRAPTSACNAHQATCCLHSLASCSDHARRLVVDAGAVESLKEALEFGEARHALLAMESRQCLKLLSV